MSLFLSRGSRDLWLSLEAFPPGFPTRLSLEALRQGCPTCHRGVSRSLALTSRQCRENRFPWNGLRHLVDSGKGGATLEFLSPFLWRAPAFEMRRERRELFPDHAGKGSLFSSYEAETGLHWMWRDPRPSSRVEMGMSENFLTCSKGVKDPLEVPEVSCD